MTGTRWSRGGSTILEEARDGLPASAAGAASEAPDAPPPPTAEHEPTYQSDLRGLVALVRQREALAVAAEPMSLEAPPSVREAIRVAGALLPTPAPALAHHRLRVVALPVIALALVGVALGATRRHVRWDRAAPPVTPVIERSSSIPPFAEAFSPLSAPSSAATLEPSSLVDEAPSVSEPPPASPAIATSRPAHPPPALAHHRSAPVAPAAVPPPSTPPELPSLMDAITDAVRSSPTAPNRR